MANRYWVGGTASWDGTAGTKWAATSGGPGGETVPTSADDVFFDSASSGTVTIASGNTGAKSINCTGFTGTFSGTADITVSGSITLSAGMTFNYFGGVTINGTGTLNTAGKSLQNLIINGAGITVDLASDLSISLNIAYVGRSVTVTQGTFNTNNYNITAGSFLSSNSNTRTINLGSSTVSLNSVAGLSVSLEFSTSTNLTFNAGTSNITFTGSLVNFFGGSQTFYDVTIPGTTSTDFTGSNTFNNLTIGRITSNGGNLVTFSSNQTINGTLTLSGIGTEPRRRTVLLTNSATNIVTLTCNAISTLYDVDFKCIKIEGNAISGGNITGTRLGDGANNSGITFDPPKTVYFRSTGSVAWSSADWSATSGGAVDNTYFPLAQDTVIFPAATYPASGSTVSLFKFYFYGTIDFSLRTSNTIKVSIGSGNNYVFGNWINGTGTSYPTPQFGTLYFAGNGTQTITSSGITFTEVQFVYESVSGTLKFADAFVTTYPFFLASGTLDANNQNVSVLSFNSSYTSSRTLTMGSGTWTVSGTGTVWNCATSTNLTVNGNTSTILLSDTSTSARTFAGGGKTYNNLTIGGSTGTSTLTISGGNTFNTIASTKTVAHTIRFTAGTTTTVSGWTVTGSAGNVVTVNSLTSGSPVYLAKSNGAIVSCNYLSIRDVAASPNNIWYAGANSTNVSGNSGWIFQTYTNTGNFLLFMR